MKIMKRLCVDGGLRRHGGWLLLVLLLWAGQVVAVEFETRTLRLTSPQGVVSHDVVVEMADTEGKRARGLMHRQSLCEACGMLFVYPEGGVPQGMWMRNTLIPLDMLFLHNDTVLHVHANAQPMDETIVWAPQGSTAVLELNAGMAEKLGIEAGWVVNVR